MIKKTKNTVQPVKGDEKTKPYQVKINTTVWLTDNQYDSMLATMKAVGNNVKDLEQTAVFHAFILQALMGEYDYIRNRKEDDWVIHPSDGAV